MDYNKLLYSYINLDDDKEDEMIIFLENNNPMYLVLDIQEEKVYGYDVVYRGMESIKTDGTYMASGGADVNYIATMSFNKKKREEHIIAESDSGTYKIDEKEVTKDEWEEFFYKFTNKEKLIYMAYPSEEDAD